MRGLAPVGRADQARRGDRRARIEDRTKAGEATQRFQPLGVIESLMFGPWQGGPLQRECGGDGLVGSDAVSKAGKILHHQSLDAEGESELTPVSQVASG